MSLVECIQEMVPPRPSQQPGSQYFFEINYHCRYQDTLTKKLSKIPQASYLKTLTWIPKAKKHYAPAHRDKITRTEDVIVWIKSNIGTYLDVFFLDVKASRYRWIVDKEMFRHIRCGIWILPWRDRHFTQKMAQFRYQIVDHFSSPIYTMYQSQDGFAPFYRGTTIYKRFVLKRNLKSGMGSNGVYLVENKGGERTERYVLKFASNKEEFHQEITALQITQDWPYSPRLVWIDYHHQALITTWCGQELRALNASKRELLRETVGKLLCQLKKQYKLFHNDVRWKNIVIQDGHVTLIDWGRASSTPNDKDPQGLVPASCLVVES
jgi:predicted Ser/Thr protein kinase